MAAWSAASAWWPAHLYHVSGAESWRPMRAVQSEKTWPESAGPVVGRAELPGTEDGVPRPSWLWVKTAAGARPVSAYGDCVRARHHLGAVLRDLESEELLDTRDAAGRYVLLDSAAANVGQASSFLSAAMGDMTAAELIVLRGCGAVPMDPVASVSLIRDADHGMWLALTRLQDARE
ncbi:uncharacterized protein [Lolium perenne]|uniref:uncharacterized protein n=1 Tax=Lolium perenne TaxID=4522 RepID=UPI003A9940C9